MQFTSKKIKNLNMIVGVGRGTIHIPKDFKEALIKMRRVKPNELKSKESTFLVDEEIRVYNFCSNVIRVAQYRISKMAIPVTHRGAVYYNNETKHYKINLRSESHLSTFTLEEEGAYVGCDHVVKDSTQEALIKDKITLPEGILLHGNFEEAIGHKVFKISTKNRNTTKVKPFKSGQKFNTVKGVIYHPILNIPAYIFEEDDSYVECRRCFVQIEQPEQKIEQPNQIKEFKEEIIIKDVSHPKLTLTPSRMTIKFTEIFEDKDRIVKFAKQIEEVLSGKVIQSLRGRFLLDNGVYNIALQIKGKDSGNETVYNFKEGEL